MSVEEIRTRQFAILILGAVMVAVGLLGLTGSLSASNVLSGTGAAVIAIIAFALGRHQSDAKRA